MVPFIRAYIKSMRLYYSFVTGIAGWLGVAYYEYLVANPAVHTIETAPTPEKKTGYPAPAFSQLGCQSDY